MSRENDCCALCARFTTQGYPEQAAHGLGKCTAFADEPIEQKFTPWSEVCVLFKRAKDLAPRREFVAKMAKQEAA